MKKITVLAMAIAVCILRILFNINNEEPRELDSRTKKLCREYANLIHYKNSEGCESWSNDSPKNPKNVGVEVDIEPFTFTTE